MGLLNDATMVNRKDTLCHDLWDRGYDPPRDKLPNAENKLLYPKRQWWAVGREPRSNRGKKRKSNDPLGLLPPEAQVRVRRQREAEAIGTRRFSVKKSRGCCQGLILGKTQTQLGRTISDYFSSRNRCILFRRLRWKSYTLSLECK